MLAGKKNIEYFKHKIHHELYLETKYDGERIQTHYDGMEIKLFSRNGVNYSHVYKDVIDILMPNLQADACILDGEVVVLEK
jgi:ATP-dependent DNA ligase